MSPGAGVKKVDKAGKNVLQNQSALLRTEAHQDLILLYRHKIGVCVCVCWFLCYLRSPPPLKYML